MALAVALMYRRRKVLNAESRLESRSWAVKSVALRRGLR